MSESWKKLVEEGNAAYERGKIPEAEVKFLAALEEAEKFGEEDARLALSLNNLAAMYHEQGKYTMAEPLYKRALDIRINIHGERHPDIALNHHNLAVLYSARRMYQVAEKHYKTALEMKEYLFGSESPELLNTLQYFAQFMKVQNRLVERQLIESRAKIIAAKVAEAKEDCCSKEETAAPLA
ncbi:MAG: tetratricopeptide repeat protein [Candidatus Obscuribacterales bacterium]|nr:tetratricopeptide repeat protein [Candidatus Obscuribacterales bacterium]